MVGQQSQVDVDAVERVQLGLELVVARQQLGAERTDHPLQLRLQLRDVDELTQLLGELQLLKLPVDLFSEGAFTGEVHAVLAAMTGGLGPQVLDVAQADLAERFVAPVEPQVGHVPADSRLIEA